LLKYLFYLTARIAALALVSIISVFVLKKRWERDNERDKKKEIKKSI